MSERGAEGILRRQAEAKAAAAPKPASSSQPVDKATAGHKPGKVSRVASGAAGGSAGGPWGAAAGALGGALAGGKKKAGGQRALVGEFMICMVILLLSPMVDKGGNVTTGKFMKKASATAAVFIILGFIASTGDTARKAANGLGMLMTLTVLLNERSVFGQLVKAVNGAGVSTGPPIHLPSSGFDGGASYSDLHTQSSGSYFGDVLSDPTVSFAAGGAAAGGYVGGLPGAGLGLVGGASVGGIIADSHVSDRDGNGLPPVQQKALQGDPLVNFFKGAADWVGSFF